MNVLHQGKACLTSWRSYAAAAILLLGSVLGASRAQADQNYSQQVFFDNSLSPQAYYYSAGKVSLPSKLRLIGDKLPVETNSFVSAPNALELDWTSAADGGWSVEIRLYQWRNRTLEFPGAYLWIWACAPDGMRAQALPRIALRDTEKNFTPPLNLSGFAPDLVAGTGRAFAFRCLRLTRLRCARLSPTG